MSRIAYVNGSYTPLPQAAVHVEDRGFQFADGIYEVAYQHEGRLIDADLHFDRLDRSLREMQMQSPVSRPALRAILGEVARRNRLRSGLLYIQITRGSAPRFHPFPRKGTPPTLVVTMRRTPPFPTRAETWTAAAITQPDERWARCDIKSVALLPNVLAKQRAAEAGALEAILFDRDGMVTEGASTSVFIVDAEGILRTRKLGHAILPGCTRAALLQDRDGGIPIEERAFSVEELRRAREIFITAATTFVKAITKLDGMQIGDGTPGPVTRALFARLAARIQGNGPPH